MRHASLPQSVKQQLAFVRALVLEEFDEAMRGKQAAHRKAGRILKLIAYGLSDSNHEAQHDGIDLLVVVNHRELADRDLHWRFAIARIRREREIGSLRLDVRLDIHCLQDVNRALTAGVPFFTSIASRGLLLYELDRTPLATPRNLPTEERCWRGRAEFERWYPRAEDFLSGAGFYREQGNMRMAALLLHQACEHLYQCLTWTLKLHGRRTHSLDELRGLAEAEHERLRTIWPRTNRFERRCFAQIRRAYVEARYEASFPMTPREIGWAMERTIMLMRRVGSLCREYLSALQSSSIANYLHV